MSSSSSSSRPRTPKSGGDADGAGAAEPLCAARARAAGGMRRRRSIWPLRSTSAAGSASRGCWSAWGRCARRRVAAARHLDSRAVPRARFDDRATAAEGRAARRSMARSSCSSAPGGRREGVSRCRARSGDGEFHAGARIKSCGSSGTGLAVARGGAAAIRRDRERARCRRRRDDGVRLVRKAPTVSRPGSSRGGRERIRRGHPSRPAARRQAGCRRWTGAAWRGLLASRPPPRGAAGVRRSPRAVPAAERTQERGGDLPSNRHGV